MKKFMLCAGLLTLTYAHAENNNSAVLATQAIPNPNQPNIITPSSPGVSTPTPLGETTPTPTKETLDPLSAKVNAPTTQTQTASSEVLNCNTHFPTKITKIESSSVSKWAENAVVQSFNFNHDQINQQLSQLQACFTEQGWQGFQDALEKSGNINAIKSHQLTVTSQVMGGAKISELKENQWKLTLPIQVVYQNEKEKLVQPLAVNLMVGRKSTGDLGIMQMIATPSDQQHPS